MPLSISKFQSSGTYSSRKKNIHTNKISDFPFLQYFQYMHLSNCHKHHIILIQHVLFMLKTIFSKLLFQFVLKNVNSTVTIFSFLSIQPQLLFILFLYRYFQGCRIDSYMCIYIYKYCVYKYVPIC